MLASQTRSVAATGYSAISGKFDPEAPFLKFRKQNLKDLFKISELFNFKVQTVHLAMAMYDHFLTVPNMVEQLRSSYKSCKAVITEQICTFIASVSLFVSAKYNEIKYPVVDDVC